RAVSLVSLFFIRVPRPPGSPLFPYTTLFRSWAPTFLATGDWNQDQIPDLASLNSENCGLRIYIGKGDGTFTLSNSYAVGVNHSRSEEHTSELQSRENLVCRLLLEKKKQYKSQ